MHARGASLDHGLHKLECIQVAAETRLGIGDDRGKPIDARVAVERMNLVGTNECIVDALDQLRYRVDRVKALVRVHDAGTVGVTGHLPSRAVDRLEARLHLLDRLVAGHRTQPAQRIRLVDEAPEFLGAQARQRVFDIDGAPESDDILRRVVASYTLPSRTFGPLRSQ